VSDVVAYEFSKNGRELVQARLTTFKGLELADLRVFVVDERGEQRPTPKGLSVRLDQIPQLLAAVQALIAASARADT
jgi:hypothetical protein